MRDEPALTWAKTSPTSLWSPTRPGITAGHSLNRLSNPINLIRPGHWDA